MIRMENVHKAFGPNRVLQGVNLEIPKGTSMVIIGGSGTGKSVTLKCVLGLIHPDSGIITLDEEDVTKADRDAFLARFGMLFQGGRAVRQPARLAKRRFPPVAWLAHAPQRRSPRNRR